MTANEIMQDAIAIQSHIIVVVIDKQLSVVKLDPC